METAGIASCWMEERRGSDAIENWEGVSIRRKERKASKSHSSKYKEVMNGTRSECEMTIAAFRKLHRASHSGTEDRSNEIPLPP